MSFLFTKSQSNVLGRRDCSGLLEPITTSTMLAIINPWIAPLCNQIWLQYRKYDGTYGIGLDVVGVYKTIGL